MQPLSISTTTHYSFAFSPLLKLPPPNPTFKTQNPRFSLSPSPPPPSSLYQILQSETLATLEWPAICRQLTPFTSTSMARSLALLAAVPVGASLDESQRLLDQTAAALAHPEPLDLSRVEDITGILDAAASGRLLTVRELCTVRRTLRAAREAFQLLVKISRSGTERCSSLVEILKRCNFQSELEQKIEYCIDCNLSVILDRASEELEFIRSERKENMENLERLLKGVSTRVFQAGGIDKPLVTRRRFRLCVGVRSTHRHLIPGGVSLDVSSSGATYFMEPADAVELNNLEVMLSDSEKKEEVIILSLLTSEIAEMDREIRHLLDGIVEVDLAFARAGHAQWVGGTCPIWTSGECEEECSDATGRLLSIDIENICHPLLLETSRGHLSSSLQSHSRSSGECDERNSKDAADEGSTVAVKGFPVPISIKVDCGTRVVVISGPNTGGKTASMKTLGIASLMSKAGFYLPAKHTPRLPWFDLVLAEIGDHQSLEQNLSTFSGHISRIHRFLEVASDKSLVLIDEICSGTDPSEGVALSTSILQHLADRVNLAVVTTHYADLCLLKEKDARFENAATEFSLETLLPTYRILWGSAGESNALTIAKSVGFDSHIIGRAQMWVEKLTPEKQLERKGVLYRSLLEERNRLEAEAVKASSLHAGIMQVYHEIQAEAEDLDVREKALKEKDSQQALQDLKTAKLQIRTIIQEFENHLKATSPDQFKSLIKKSEETIASIVESHKPLEGKIASERDANLYTLKPGQQVRIKSFGNRVATVVEVTDDDETMLVQYGKVRARVKKSDVTSTRLQRTGVLD